MFIFPRQDAGSKEARVRRNRLLIGDLDNEQNQWAVLQAVEIFFKTDMFIFKISSSLSRSPLEKHPPCRVTTAIPNWLIIQE